MKTPLDETEVRVLGSLIEKEFTTPEYYPLSLNALVSACNQKSNRDPVVSYGEDEVIHALDVLQRRHLVGTSTGAGSRVVKYRHAARQALSLDDRHIAVLGILMLRGPQTAGEIKGRTSRMYAFSSVEEVLRTLKELAAEDHGLVSTVARLAGQKEDRFAHLLAGEPDMEKLMAARDGSRGDAERISQLEETVANLREELAELRDDFLRLKAAFE